MSLEPDTPLCNSSLGEPGCSQQGISQKFYQRRQNLSDCYRLILEEVGDLRNLTLRNYRDALTIRTVLLIHSLRVDEGHYVIFEISILGGISGWVSRACVAEEKGAIIRKREAPFPRSPLRACHAG